MDLRSKLGLYKENNAKQQDKLSPSGYDVQDIVPGAVFTNDSGSFYVIENRYPSTYIYGGCGLGAATEISSNCLSRLLPESVSTELVVENLLFLDTETTGLSRGVGTVAFLVGVGFFEKSHFVVRQLFMRDYDEEPAMLDGLNELLLKFPGLITFNGKSFDWNLLQGRFISNRIKPALKSPLQLDLLYPSRSIWSLKLEHCRLSSLEENVLGEYRTDDIPGSMIPEVYFKYLQDRNASDIKKVIKHNELDILSMVALLVKIASMLENPLDRTDGEHELLGLGRIFEKNGEIKNYLDCFEHCINSGNYPVKSAAAKRLSGIYKRNGDYAKAVGLWKDMAEESSNTNIYPLIEMAMYYEHKEKDIPKALEIVEKVLVISRQTGLSDVENFSELMKRYERLKRKAQKMVNT